MTWLTDWWTCRQRFSRLDAKLKAAGLHHRDPVYALIREMAVLPDRLLRWLLVQFLILLVVAISLLAWANYGNNEIVVVPGTTAGSRIVIINAPGGMRWVTCMPARSCLEVFLEHSRSQ